MSITSQRAGGLAGIGFGLIVLTVNIILGSAGQPFSGAPKQEVLDFFATSEGAVRLGSAAAPLAWIFLGVFAAGVAAAARRASVAEPTAGPRRPGGSGDAERLFAVVVACQLVLVNGDLSTDVAWGVWELHNAVFLLNALSLAVIMLSLSIAGLKSGLISTWHGRSASLPAA